MTKRTERQINGSNPTVHLKWVNGKLMQKHELQVRILHYLDDSYQYSDWILEHE